MDGTRIYFSSFIFLLAPFLVKMEKENDFMNISKTQKLTISALCMALYLVVMICTQSFAFGQYQVRISTALYALSAIFPFLIVPFGLANILSNTFMGGLGIVDMIGGGIVGILTTSLIVYAKRLELGNWAIMLVITFIPGLLVPIWLSFLLEIPYWVLASALLVGQLICGIVGMLFVTALERCEVFNFVTEKK